MAQFSSSHDVQFEDVVSRLPKLPLASTIPKIGHIVHTKLSQATWINYASARAFLENVVVERLNIWVPEGEELPGEMWGRITSLANVTVRHFYVPKKVWGMKLDHPAHWSDVSRIKILYEEGGAYDLSPEPCTLLCLFADWVQGIYLDTDVLALKSSDDIILDPQTRATVMTRQLSVAPLINAVIMSKAESPFLHRWMEAYRNFNVSEWDHMTSWVPHDMFLAGEPDLTLLDDHAWMYPKRHGKADDTSHPHLSQMWTGKSWHDIDYSYGVHFWKWLGYAKDLVHMTPDMARNIDTPLFCRLRKLFDNVDGDGYFSMPWEENPNCTVSWVKDLDVSTHRLFADYRMDQDTMDMKWVDSSGHSNHGWAGHGTDLVRTNNTTEVARRRFGKGDHAWLPVPVDWDARVGTARVTLQLNPQAFNKDEKEIGLFKIRVDWTGEIVLSLKLSDIGRPLLRFRWEAPPAGDVAYKKLQTVGWTSTIGLPLSPDSPNELAISFDRKDMGVISVYMDGRSISNGTLPLLASASIPGEIWMNGRDWRRLDAGFRGEIYRFCMYADALQPQDMARVFKAQDTARSDSSFSMLPSVHPLLRSLAFLCALLLLVAVATWRHRSKPSKYLGSLLPDRYISTTPSNESGQRIVAKPEVP